MQENEKYKQLMGLYKKFDRFGQVTQPAKDREQRRATDYKVTRLEQSDLPLQDQIVRAVEGAFAPLYDTQQFATPGMRNMARTDTALAEKWIGSPLNQRILDIGPGTGRLTLPIADSIGNGKVYAIETAVEYLDELRLKAAKTGLNPDCLKLGIGDIQSISLESLRAFTEQEKLDFVTMWFGPLALMPSEPQKVLNDAAALLKEGGSLLITTNSLNGLAYRVPEKAIANGEDAALPLGYRPSIFTRRKFSPEDLINPSGMILGTDQILPAIFYDPTMLIPMLEQAGLEVQEVQGITRLTGLFPADPKDKDALRKYIDVIESIDEEAAAAMNVAPKNSKWVWEVAKTRDINDAKNPDKLSQYTYTAYKAVKPLQ